MSDSFDDFEDANRRLKALEAEKASEATRRDKLLQKKAELEKQLKSLGGSNSSAKRKARNHKLIALGALVDMAGLGDVEIGLLLGYLMSAKKSFNDPAEASRLKDLGSQTLEQRKAAIKKTKPVEQKAAPKPTGLSVGDKCPSCHLGVLKTDGTGTGVLSCSSAMCTYRG